MMNLLALAPLLLFVQSGRPQAEVVVGGQKAPERTPAAQATTLVIYDVRDLHPAGPPPAEAAGGAGSDAADSASRTYAELAEWIRAHASPPIAGGGQSIQALPGGSLVVQAGAGQHAWIAGFLDLQRRSKDVIYQLDVRLVKLPREALARLAAEGELMRVMSAREMGEWLVRFKSEPGADVVLAPKVTVFNRQRATISVGRQVAYIADFRVYDSVEPGGIRVVDPVIEVASEGIEVGAQAVRISEDGLRLELSLTQTEIERPIRTFETEHGAVSLPVVKKRTIESSLLLEGTQGAILPGLVEDDVETILLVEMRLARPARGPVESGGR